MSPLFKKKEFFSAAQKERIVAAIRAMEQQTSGEIRVFVENKNPLVDPVERAKQVFHKLNMEHTKHRNGVLLYIAVKHRELALYGDEGIYKAAGTAYWNDAVKKMIAHFKGNDIAESIVDGIYHIGQTLKEIFPFDPEDDVNELPGDIVYGE
jgi:uncharacterized membrane protein